MHDNLGARRDTARPPASTRCASTCICRRAAAGFPGSHREPLLERNAPLVLEVHPPHRPEPLTLSSITAEVLLRDRPSVGGAPRSGLASVPLG